LSRPLFFSVITIHYRSFIYLGREKGKKREKNLHFLLLSRSAAAKQGCQIFLGTTYQNIPKPKKQVNSDKTVEKIYFKSVKHVLRCENDNCPQWNSLLPL
jgi:hypothetical protein